MAVGDLLAILICLPFISIEHLQHYNWSFGVFNCKLYLFIGNLSTSVTIFTLSVLSIDQFKTIVNPISTNGQKWKILGNYFIKYAYMNELNQLY